MRTVYSYFSNRFWVKGENGKRLTPKSRWKYSVFSNNDLVTVVMNPTTHDLMLFRKDTEELLYCSSIHTYPSFGTLFNKYFAINLDSIALVIDENYNITYFKYIYIFDTGFGMAIIKEDEGKYSYISEDLTLAINTQFKNARAFNKFGYAWVKTLDGVSQIIDTKGNVIISKVDGAYEFLNEKYLTTYLNGGHGLVDIQGKRILPNFYSSISVLNEKYFLITKNGKKGIADLSGNILLEPIYDEIMETQDKYVVRDFTKKEVLKEISVSK